MPASKKPSASFDDTVRFHTIADFDRAIHRFRYLIEEVAALTGTRHDDDAKQNARDAISATIREVFGADSPEFHQHQFHDIWRGDYGFNLPDDVKQARFKAGISITLDMLETLAAQLEVKRREFLQDDRARVRSVFEVMDLHRRIVSACEILFYDGHYRQAILDGSLALVNYVMEKSGERDGLSSSGLMTKVFSKNNPILRFNDLTDQTDRDEQEGFMHLFLGAVLAVRNPRAHAFLDDSPEIALDYIAFLSMLARRLDTAKRT